ncbi:MAG: DNA polymerase Y family protein [Hyphomicrobiaceae bacterium]|nr:DNA polymerase Y family protein [Hyphomicrobiaceae bacterium]
MSPGEGPDDSPLVVAEKVRGALRIAAVDQRASKLGLTQGLTLADAHARIPNLAVAEADAASDGRFIDRLAEFCDRFTPSVALDSPNGLVLDITGCTHLLGGEAGLQAKVLARLNNIGLTVRSSIACTPDAARALARFSKIAIAPPGKSEVLVKRLPVAALCGLERETVLALSRAGLKTIGDLSERPSQVLAARFGPGLVTRVMQTLGRENARITPLRSLPSVVVDRHFPEPFTQTEALEGVLASLLEDVVSIMQERDEGGRVFEASFFRSDGAIRRLAVQTGRPSRDVLAILRLYRERLDTLGDPIDSGFGFDAIRLAVPVTEALNQTQPHLDGHHLEGEAGENEAVGDLVDKLIVRFGRDRVLRFSALDTHDPDQEARLVSAAGMSVPNNRITTRGGWPEIAQGEPPLRPLQLFAPPQPIETLAEVPDGPPLRFRWRRVLHDVRRSEGPERIEPEWWRRNSDAQTRDYYRVEDTAGGRFWIFCQGFYGQADAHKRWFLHGVFA